MTDISRLAAGLAAYRDSLRVHRTRTEDAFTEVEKAWHALAEIYAGAAAEEFTAHWDRSRQAFADYLDQTQTLTTYLDDKVDSIREADRLGGL